MILNVAICLQIISFEEGAGWTDSEQNSEDDVAVRRFISLGVSWKAPASQNELMFSVLQDWPRWALWGWSAGVIFPENESLGQSLGSVLFRSFTFQYSCRTLFSLFLLVSVFLSLSLSIQNLGFLLCGTFTSVLSLTRASLAAQLVKNLPAIAGDARDTGSIPGWGRSPAEGNLEKKMSTHSSILAWKIPRTEEPGGLLSVGLQRVRQDWGLTHWDYHGKLPSSVCVLSCVLLFMIPWPVACQAPLSMGFSKQEYCSGLPFPTPGDSPNPWVEPATQEWNPHLLQFLHFLHWQVGSLPLATWKAPSFSFYSSETHISWDGSLLP